MFGPLRPRLRLVLALVLALLASCATQPADDAGRKAKVEELYASFKAELKDVQEITAEDLQAKLKQDINAVLLVDVRTPAEQQVLMIPGAIRAEDFLKLPPEQRAGKLVRASSLTHTAPSASVAANSPKSSEPKAQKSSTSTLAC